MFIIRMQGGLGNQIFIFLFYMSLCKQYGEKNVSIDLSSYKRFHAHTGYILEDVFDILPLNKCDLRDAKKYSTEIIYTDRLGYLSNHINYIGKIVDYYNTFIAPRKKNKNFYKEKKSYGFDGNVYNFSIYEKVYFSGYWQNINYFKDMNVINVLTFKGKYFVSKSDIDNYNDRVFIHIRGGDYLNIEQLSLCKKNYYIKAVAHMKKLCSCNKYIVFTDDEKYAKSILDNIGIHYDIYTTINGDPISDLREMSMYKYGIISNSTYGFWGAVLTREKIICSPKYWLKNNDGKLIGPAMKGWEIIENV